MLLKSTCAYAACTIGRSEPAPSVKSPPVLPVTAQSQIAKIVSFFLQFFSFFTGHLCN